MLDSNSFHLEICYNAAGVLSHICSDGDAAWTLKSISRNDCMKRVVSSHFDCFVLITVKLQRLVVAISCATMYVVFGGLTDGL